MAAVHGMATTEFFNMETLASPLYFEIAKWAAGTGCSVELPIPMGRP
ncbi:MAG: hypothetical protein EZS28_027782, partial [Streblomastix strix]